MIAKQDYVRMARRWGQEFRQRMPEALRNLSGGCTVTVKLDGTDLEELAGLCDRVVELQDEAERARQAALD